jgi:DNA polymerase epsilon subunit 3
LFDVQDALSALSESAKVFISYLTATANELCKEKKRATISSDDVLNALEELEFAEFVEPLQLCIQGKWTSRVFFEFATSSSSSA